MHYREVIPRAELRQIVRCFWHLLDHDAPPNTPDRVVPDGCTEIVLNRADRFRRDERTQARVLLVGQLSGAIEIAPTGGIDLLGIRFEPAGLHLVLGTPMHELTDLDVCLRQVRPGLYTRLRRANEAPDPYERIRRIERALLDARPLRSDGLIAEAARRLAKDATTVFDLAASLSVGRRTLERRFRREVGLAPRHFARICRLQRVISVLDDGLPAEGWAGLAAGAGYFDQSHLIRDFRLIAGTTPARYVAEQPGFADAFATGVSHPSNP